MRDRNRVDFARECEVEPCPPSIAVSSRAESGHASAVRALMTLRVILRVSGGECFPTQSGKLKVDPESTASSGAGSPSNRWRLSCTRSCGKRCVSDRRADIADLKAAVQNINALGCSPDRSRRRRARKGGSCLSGSRPLELRCRSLRRRLSRACVKSGDSVDCIISLGLLWLRKGYTDLRVCPHDGQLGHLSTQLQNQMI